jgi:hypothetical protein
VPFDLKHGFDAEARAAIVAALKPLHLTAADIDAVIMKLEEAARSYIEAKRKPRRSPTAERDRYAKMTKHILQLRDMLNYEHQRRREPADDWAKPILGALAVANRKASARRAAWTAWARAYKGGGDPDLDLLYFMIFEAWIEADGKLVVADTKMGRALVNFLRVTMASIGHPLTDKGARKVVRRFNRDYKHTRAEIERRRGASKS